MSSIAKASLRATVIAALGLAGQQAHALCTFNGPGSEQTLQSVFNGLLGADSVNVVTACMDEGADSLWNTDGQIGTVDIRVELAGNRNSNTFGLFDPYTGARIQLFEGNDGANTVGIVQVNQLNGQWRVRVRDTTASPGENTSWTPYVNLTSNVFGFYLGAAGNNFFYSATGRNTDGVDHMYAYGPLGGESAGEYILAWEDLFGGGDRDYQDFVATCRTSARAVADGGLAAGSGLIGLAGVARRRDAELHIEHQSQRHGALPPADDGRAAEKIE